MLCVRVNKILHFTSSGETYHETQQRTVHSEGCHRCLWHDRRFWRSDVRARSATAERGISAKPAPVMNEVLRHNIEDWALQGRGVPEDWSHHHLVFSNPGTEEDAIANGTHDRWLSIVNDPRYIIQQLKRRAARGPVAANIASIEQTAQAAARV